MVFTAGIAKQKTKTKHNKGNKSHLVLIKAQKKWKKVEETCQSLKNSFVSLQLHHIHKFASHKVLFQFGYSII